MKLLFSRHAKRQMKWRRITEQEVAAVIADPDMSESSVKGRINACKVIMGRNLKVTCKKDGDTITVITAMVKGAKQ